MPRARDLGLLAAMAFAFLAAPRPARGQACCAGAALVTPARLAMRESVLVGGQLRLTRDLGSFDANGRYLKSPSETSETDFEEDLLVAVRVLGDGQLALQIPFVETRRTTPVAAELGGGLGDVNIGARYDFTYAGDPVLPGIAVLAGVTLPTGRAPDQARSALATDATGVGAVQASLGLALEQTFGRWLVNLTGIVSQRFPRTVEGLSERLGVLFAGNVAAGYLFRGGEGLALVAHFEAEGAATVDGVRAPDSSRRSSTLALVFGLPVDDRWRMQLACAAPVAITGFGENQLAGLVGSFTLIRSWP